MRRRLLQRAEVVFRTGWWTTKIAAMDGASGGQYELQEPNDLVRLLVSMAKNKLASSASKQLSQKRDGQQSRFRAEAQAAAALRHPNIVQIDEVGDAAGQPYLVMEYVTGGTLEQFQKCNRIAFAEAAELVRVLADAVHAAHQNGILHHDLRPGNILLAATTGTWTRFE